MADTMQETIRGAIDRSISHDEIVRITLTAGDLADALAEIGALYDGNTDGMIVDDELDVWGYTDEQENGDMAWRLIVRIA